MGDAGITYSSEAFYGDVMENKHRHRRVRQPFSIEGVGIELVYVLEISIRRVWQTKKPARKSPRSKPPSYSSTTRRKKPCGCRKSSEGKSSLKSNHPESPATVHFWERSRCKSCFYVFLPEKDTAFRVSGRLGSCCSLQGSPRGSC